MKILKLKISLFLVFSKKKRRQIILETRTGYNTKMPSQKKKSALGNIKTMIAEMKTCVNYFAKNMKEVQKIEKKGKDKGNRTPKIRKVGNQFKEVQHLSKKSPRKREQGKYKGRKKRERIPEKLPELKDISLQVEMDH